MSPSRKILESADDHGILLQSRRFDASHWVVQRYIRFRYLGAPYKVDLETASTHEKEIGGLSRVRYWRAVSAIIPVCLHEFQGSGLDSIDADESLTHSFE